MLLMSLACDAIALGSNQVEVEVEVLRPLSALSQRLAGE
ncbi:hypothetical protein BROOK1789B_182 [Bathymodiolus brooksi thiotrophic gill symbiont]|nr:hypothetical protein BROOK1789B_182 [Bathymodiolus brooksi thiotrophic gill symbiont]